MIARCPECGRVISLHFPLHECVPRELRVMPKRKKVARQIETLAEMYRRWSNASADGAASGFAAGNPTAWWSALEADKWGKKARACERRGL